MMKAPRDHPPLTSMTADNDNTEAALSSQLLDFVERMPKVELHAHLNGCIREGTLAELAAERNVTLSTHHFELLTSSPHSKDNTCMLYNRKPRSLKDCFDMFAEIPKCVDDIEALKRIAREALEDFAAHHVLYLELRSTPKRLLWNHNNKNDLATKRDYVETILSVMESFEKKQSWPVPRFIVSIDRSSSLQDATENAQLAIDLFRSRNKYIVGVDLGGNPTKNDFSVFEPVFQMVRDARLKVTLHCGEVPGSETHDKTYKEMEAVLKFRPDRVGHALLLPPSLGRLLAESRIPVECCPTSNVMTLELATHFDGNLVHGLKRHPQLERWLETNHPLSVSTDDSGVFNTNPTQELLLLAMAWNLDQDRLQDIVLRSIQHGFCDDDTKLELHQQFEDQIKTIANPSAEMVEMSQSEKVPLLVMSGKPRYCELSKTSITGASPI